jgi:hypothetical protein
MIETLPWRLARPGLDAYLIGENRMPGSRGVAAGIIFSYLKKQDFRLVTGPVSRAAVFC